MRMTALMLGELILLLIAGLSSVFDINYEIIIPVSGFPLSHQELLHRQHQLRLHKSQPNSGADSDSDSDNIMLNGTVHWFNQTLDHFGASSEHTFGQRYYKFMDYFDEPNGPIFLIICGESTCPGIPNDFVAVLARQFNAALVTLEHRYYGYSSPFIDLSTPNLKYLSSNQALFDLATFRNYFQDQVNQKYNKEEDNKWFVFGGSYAGALSAWFRLKFPHLVQGSLASSAVVNAIEDFYQFDQHVGRSVGPICTRALKEVRMLVDNYIRANKIEELKSDFNAKMIHNDIDFLSLLADSMALAVQYGYQDDLCKPIVKSFQERKNVMVPFKRFVLDFIYGYFGVSPIDYNREHIRNSTVAGEGSGPRLWTYQICSEFGFFQTAPMENNIRFSQLNEEYYLDFCSYLFGEGIRPKPAIVNHYYGGNRIAGSRIIFTNGSQDPWRAASKQESTHNEPAFVIMCKNCGHCVDLIGCPQFPLNIEGDGSKCQPHYNIDHTRNSIMKLLEQWIKD